MLQTQYIQMNFIPFVAMIVLYINARHMMAYVWRNQCFRFLMLLSAITMALDSFAWMCDGAAFPGCGGFLIVCNTLYFALMEACTFLWMLYAYDFVNEGARQRGRKVIPFAIPLFVFYALLLVNFIKPVIFYIDEQNVYHRGPLFAVHYLISIGYLLTASVFALYRAAHAVTKKQRQEMMLLAAFIVLPILGSVLQIFSSDVEFIWSFAAASLMMVYIKRQKEQAAFDSLTELNNRHRFDEYIKSLIERTRGKEDWYLIILDVDKFKKINDNYGHVVGDEVLHHIAVLLKREFGAKKTFLARYGGDEFAIIYRTEKEESVIQAIRELESALEKHPCGKGGNVLCRATLSIGYQRYDSTKDVTPEQIIAGADEQMYQKKRMKK